MNLLKIALVLIAVSSSLANAAFLNCSGRTPFRGEEINVIVRGFPSIPPSAPVPISVTVTTNTDPTPILANSAGVLDVKNFEYTFIFAGGTMVVTPGNFGITGASPNLQGTLTIDRFTIDVYCPLE